jgi:Flp pilus assembly pilin Flp
MLEYIIIVALIAISLIAVFTYFGGAVGKKVAGATEAIDDGDAAQGARNKADEIIDGAESGNVIKRLGNN